MATDDIRWESHQAPNCLILTPRGELDSRTYRTFRNDLVRFALDQPDALIVVVDQLRIGSTGSLAAFSSAWMQISEWPGVPILLVAEQAELRAMLDGSAIARYLPVHSSLRAAVAGLRDPPLRRRSEIELVPVASNSRLARVFVHRTCTEWNVNCHLPEAVEVATELVENSIIHARTDLRLRLELHYDRLAVAVRDGSPREAVLRERVRGPASGLRLVAELATVWGRAPDLGGGKVVWAVLTTHRRP